ncbi:Fe(3+) dicitrate transport protein [Janthinobacterium sp. CG_23.3]|uniref:TonB-dependent receptor family protein n=1 Tax=Janthinobacterium sp. CG_23.3 TaxID=3349634 RepID=UPI0038D3D4FB
MKQLPRHTLTATACAMLAAMNASAQGAAPTPDAAMETVQINGNWLGSGLQNKVKNFAGARTLVEREAISDSGASNIGDVMRRVPGVQVTDNSSSGGSSISLNIGVRGLEGRYSPRSTVLLDGLPMAVAPYGQPHLSFAPVSLNNVESVDVVRGGAAVRYGPQNVGGVINFKTRAIPDQALAADASVRYNSYAEGGGSRQYSAFVGGRNEAGLGLALLYSATRGSAWRPHSDEQVDDLALKWRYQLSPSAEVYGKLSHYEAASAIPGGLTTAQYAADPFQSVRSHDAWSGRRNGVDVGYVNALSATQEFEVRAFYHQSLRASVLADKADADAKSVATQPRNYDVNGIEPRYTHSLQLGGMRHDVTLGYRYLRERADESSSTRVLKTNIETVTRRSDNSTDAHAAYVDDQIHLGKWRVTPGLRVEDIKMGRVDLLTGASEEVGASKALPVLNVAYLLSKQVTLFGNYNTSFGSIQHAHLNLSPSGKSLRPELAKTVELGARLNRKDWKAEATVFDMRFDNQFQYQATEKYYLNLGKTHHRGLETSVDYTFGRAGALAGLNAYATYAYTKATIEAGANAGNDLPYYSRNTDTLGLRYALGGWTVKLSTTHQSRQFGDELNTVAASADGSTGVIPGYRLWQTQISRKFAGTPALEWQLGVNNVNDKRYFTRTTDTNKGQMVGAPRMVYVQLLSKF